MKIEATASNWTDAFKAVIPHSAPSTARDIPVLQTVRIETDESGTSLIATDRYTLIVRHLDAESTGTGDVLIETADAQRIISICRDWLRLSVPLTLSVDAGRVTFTTPDSSATFRAFDATFPPYRSLIAGAVESLDGERASDCSLSAALLAKWAKSCGKNEAIQVRLTRSAKVVLIVGETFIGLQMPVRRESFTVPDWARGVAPSQTAEVA